MHKEQVLERYEARIDTIDHLHDGDTINETLFKLPDIQPAEGAVLREIYPDIFIQSDGVWMRVNIRVAGIDCPEIHPHHFYPGGTPRPTDEIARERKRATQARDAVAEILLHNKLEFEIRNPEFGKYAGRIVAEVWAKDLEYGDLINISTHLIDKNLAYPYEGGKKRIWGRD